MRWSRAGSPLLEITLRTPVALEAMRGSPARSRASVCGAGTVLDVSQLKAAEQAGAKFAVSPGATQHLIAAARRSAMPLLPGAATASEVMALAEQGYFLQKFFPAEPMGGAATLGALASPIPMVRFCPTGGIDQAKAATYLKLGECRCRRWLLDGAQGHGCQSRLGGDHAARLAGGGSREEELR